MNDKELRDAFDLESLSDFLGQFGDVKKHLLSAGTEVMLALKALLDQLIKALEEDFPAGRGKYEFLYVLQYGVGFLSSRLSPLSRTPIDPEQEKRAKLAALESILRVVESEMRPATEAASAAARDTEQIRHGALRAIANVLKREIDSLKTGAPTPKPRPKSTRRGAGGKPTRPARRVPVD